MRRLFSSRGAGVAAAPFFVKRTSSNNLPVYTVTRRNGSLLFTEIRKVRGNSEELRAEIAAITQSRVEKVSDGVLRVQGNHKLAIKKYLAGNLL